jgi:hypothetical protein
MTPRAIAAIASTSVSDHDRVTVLAVAAAMERYLHPDHNSSSWMSLILYGVSKRFFSSQRWSRWWDPAIVVRR